MKSKMADSCVVPAKKAHILILFQFTIKIFKKLKLIWSIMPCQAPVQQSVEYPFIAISVSVPSMGQIDVLKI